MSPSARAASSGMLAGWAQFKQLLDARVVTRHQNGCKVLPCQISDADFILGGDCRGTEQ